LEFCFKNCPIPGQAVHSQIFPCRSGRSPLGIDFLRQFRITVAPETSQVLFACTAKAPAAKSFLPNVSPIAEPSVSVPPATQPIPDFVPEDVKGLLQIFLSILSMGDVMPTPTRGVEHHIHTGSHPSVFAKSRRLDPRKT
jgi:hypothetical protein